jgi:CO/xanthine dehydrogenase Mo-binding subunit
MPGSQEQASKGIGSECATDSSLIVFRRAEIDVVAEFETFIAIRADSSVTAFCGHVDLGIGIRTALAQIVAEELYISLARVTMVLGDTKQPQRRIAHFDQKLIGGARQSTNTSKDSRRSGGKQR